MIFNNKNVNNVESCQSAIKSAVGIFHSIVSNLENELQKLHTIKSDNTALIESKQNENKVIENEVAYVSNVMDNIKNIINI